MNVKKIELRQIFGASFKATSHSLILVAYYFKENKYFNPMVQKSCRLEALNLLMYPDNSSNTKTKMSIYLYFNRFGDFPTLLDGGGGSTFCCGDFHTLLEGGGGGNALAVIISSNRIFSDLVLL